MDKIYVIVNDIYNSNILGYANNEDDAKKICAYYNENDKTICGVRYFSVEEIPVIGEFNKEICNKYQTLFYVKDINNMKFIGSLHEKICFKRNNYVEKCGNELKDGILYLVFIYTQSKDRKQIEKESKDFLIEYLQKNN